MTRHSNIKGKPLPDHARAYVRGFTNQVGAVEIVLKDRQKKVKYATGEEDSVLASRIGQLHALRHDIVSMGKGRKTRTEVSQFVAAVTTAQSRFLGLVGSLPQEVKQAFYVVNRSEVQSDQYLASMRAQLVIR
ncbi:MAG: hypothetical protein Q7S22_05465 [Candidatus Micrarchaeota archaeon]|nr:hypothetical protein [Candidatus Micrarchaeota archaeon]